jgi:2,4-dienoyl-CoA reductase-like NADH-dependent reductase (Old Yellow Enzyme family)
LNDRLNVLSPLVIGQHTLKNRIVFGPHRTNFAVANRPGDRHVSYFEERARGGAALIVVEGGVVHPSDYPYENAIFAFKKETETGYRRIAEAAHRYGSLVAAQLNHYGGQATGGLSRREVWAPSPFPEVNTGEVPKAMEEEDIREVVEGFADCAARLCGLGLDGVEINAGQNSLLRQFLSPLTNFRTDAYGGSLENRARFCREVLEAVRRAAGPGPIVGLRICGDEYAPWGGLKPEDSRDLVLHLCGGGLVDYVAVEVGSIYSLHLTAASMRYPEDYAVPPARLMAQSLTVPVCAAGSVVSLELAESLLAEGIQLVEMTRALIADPYLPVRSGCGEGEIRPCILCNQGCFVHWEMNPKLTCTVNPRAGREGEMPGFGKPAARPKKVLVAGAGPAGLEAACTAAERGHGVVVYDRRDRPGGRLGLAAKVPGCGRFQNIIDFLYHRALSLGVRFHFGRPADQSAVASESAEAVIAATGSLPSPAISGGTRC